MLSALMESPSYRESDRAASWMLDASRSPTLTFRRPRTPAGVAAFTGGPCMRRLVICAVVGTALVGCGSWSRVGSRGDEPTPSESFTRALNTTQFYQKLGRLAAGDPLPFVGNVA